MKEDARTDEMIEQQEQLNGSLTIIELTKIYRFLLWKFAHFKRSVLVFAYITFTTIRCPCDKMLSLEYWLSNLHQRRDIKRSDWWNDWTARVIEGFLHYHRTYKNLQVLSFAVCSFRKKCPWRNLCAYRKERSLPLDALVINYHHQNTGQNI